MNYSKYYSVECQELVGMAQDIALDLGDEKIDTIHFILADCLLNKDFSLRGLLFKNEEEFTSFYNSKRVAEGRVLADTPNGFLRLTRTAKLSIRDALSQKSKYNHSLVQPHHLFLAMSLIDSTVFQLNETNDDLYSILLAYYTTKGHTFEVKKQLSWIYKLKLLVNKARF